MVIQRSTAYTHSNQKERMLEILDTLPAFLSYWESTQGLEVDERIDRWASDYLSPWPDLLEVQVEDYRRQGLDYREIARTRIFPLLEKRLAGIHAAHDRLLQVLPVVAERVESRFDTLGDLLCVVHVGLGCGAGWAMHVRERPAVLFGLENIVECGWMSIEALQGLAAHEFGHLLLDQWRRDAGVQNGEGLLWQLFEEGFAQQVALEATGIWHLALGHESSDWLDWCEAQLAQLTRRYLESIREGRPVNEFFGSWLEIEGHSQVGVFLGVTVLQRLRLERSLRELAVLPRIDDACFEQLKLLAGGM